MGHSRPFRPWAAGGPMSGLIPIADSSRPSPLVSKVPSADAASHRSDRESLGVYEGLETSASGIVQHRSTAPAPHEDPKPTVNEAVGLKSTDR